MSLLQENIVYIWLLPVVAQIVLPLSMLLIWSVKKILKINLVKNTASESAFNENIGV